MRERRWWCELLVGAAILLAAPSPSAAATPGAPQIHTVGGGGACVGPETAGGPCDAVAVSSVPIKTVSSLTLLAGGGYAYVDSSANLVREVSANGIVTTVAGNGSSVDAPDGTVAIKSGLNGPAAVAPLADGGLLITERAGGVVRMLSPGAPGAATLTTIAGNGVNGSAGAPDPGTAGNATSVELNGPTDAVQGPDGGVLIADTNNDAIMRLDAAAPGATMTTLAGTRGVSGFGGDGGAARAARLDQPQAVAVTADGSVLIADTGNAVIRRIAPGGVISTVAGTPTASGAGGDGGPATAAQLSQPQGVAATGDGGFLIADSASEVIRRVTPAGIISTVAGTANSAGYRGDGGAATAAELNGPSAVVQMSDGDLLIADAANGVIRQVTIPPVSTITLSPPVANGEAGWYTVPVMAGISATQDAQIRCQLDPTVAPPAYGALPPDPCPYAGGGAPVTGDGTHTLYAASSNSFGDQESPAAATFKIDTTPPTLTCTGPASFTFGSDASLSASVADPISGPSAATVLTRVSTDQLGASHAQLTGSDRAGLVATVSCPFTVVPRRMTSLTAVRAVFSHLPVSRGHAQTIHDRSRRGPRRLSVLHLTVDTVERDATVSVACRGALCPFAQRVVGPVGACARSVCTATGPTIDLGPLFAGRPLSAGAVLTIVVAAPGAVSRRWRIVARPSSTRLGPPAKPTRERRRKPASRHPLVTGG